MISTLLDHCNPDRGWIVAPLAMASEKALQTAMIDPTIPEVMYAVAALIYALAAYKKRRPTRKMKSVWKSISTFRRKAKNTESNAGNGS